jgi:hypothetical protein
LEFLHSGSIEPPELARLEQLPIAKIIEHENHCCPNWTDFTLGQADLGLNRRMR